MSVEIFEKLLDRRIELFGILMQGQIGDMAAYSTEKAKVLNLDSQQLVDILANAPDEATKRSQLIEAFQGDVRAANGFDLGYTLQEVVLDYLKFSCLFAEKSDDPQSQFILRKSRTVIAQDMMTAGGIGEAQANEIARRFETAVQDAIKEIQGRGPAG